MNLRRLVRRPVAVLLAGLLGFTAAAVAVVPAQADPVSGDLTWGVSDTFVGFGHQVLDGVTFDNSSKQFTFPAAGVRTAADGTVTASFTGAVEKGFVNAGTFYYSVTIADPVVVVAPDGEGRIEAKAHSTGSFTDPTEATEPTEVTLVEFSGAVSEEGVVTGTPDWEGVLPAGSARALDLGITRAGQPVEGRSFHPDFLGALHPDVRSHFYWSGGGEAKRPVPFLIGGSVDETPDPPGDGAREVSDAVFNWGLSNQTNARSHNPLAFNFLAAGVANPGRGGVELKRKQWNAKTGPVTIQKRNADGRWRTATWGGLTTDATGKQKIGAYGPFSDHRVNITGGSGEVDPASNSAELSWKGTFTVVYYGGNTVFTLTDPTLTVTNGRGVLKATAGGWLAAREDTDKWVRAKPELVTISTLSNVTVKGKGFVVTPDYAGVRVTGSEKQIRTGDHWGSFHQEFVSYLMPLGTDQFWYSTGLEADWTKVPEPVAVGWGGATPPEPVPTDPPTERPDPKNPVNRAPEAPPFTPGSPLPPVAAAPGLPLSTPFSAALPAERGVGPGLRFPGQPTQVTATNADLRQVSAVSSTNAPWYVAGSLLLAASVVLLLGPGRRRTP